MCGEMFVFSEGRYDHGKKGEGLRYKAIKGDMLELFTVRGGGTRREVDYDQIMYYKQFKIHTESQDTSTERFRPDGCPEIKRC